MSLLYAEIPTGAVQRTNLIVHSSARAHHHASSSHPTRPAYPRSARWLGGWVVSIQPSRPAHKRHRTHRHAGEHARTRAGWTAHMSRPRPHRALHAQARRTTSIRSGGAPNSPVQPPTRPRSAITLRAAQSPNESVADLVQVYRDHAGCSVRATIRGGGRHRPILPGNSWFATHIPCLSSHAAASMVRPDGLRPMSNSGPF